LTTHQREKSREIFMSNEDAKLLNELAHNWCQDKVSEPRCQELEALVKKLKLDNL
jgi:hypothetical protein